MGDNTVKTGRMKPCAWCGAEFYCHPCRDEGGSLTLKRFCKRACYDAHRADPKTREALFWSHVRKTDACWLYEGTISFEGYGYVNIHGIGKNREQWQAHRYAWTLLKGPIPAGKFLLHHCDVRNCVNPDHLYLGGHKENAADKMRRGRYNHRYTPVEKLLWPQLSKRLK